MNRLDAERLNAFQVFLAIRGCVRARHPMSVIRLGDGEGAIMGYPTMTTRMDVDRSLKIWLRHTDVDDRDVVRLSEALKEAVREADIVGAPRRKQIQDGFRLWRTVHEEISAFQLPGPDTALTHTALHRLLQHALLYRPLLRDADFLGVITCRRVEEPLRELFGIGEVRWYGVRGELEDTGEIETPHFPDGFEELRETLEVPYRGAVFLVGAGVFGKIYCQWIKERGGIAIDIGSVFDAWAGVGRVGESELALDVYRQHPRIGRADAIRRYNALADKFALDVPKGDTEAKYAARLPPEW